MEKEACSKAMKYWVLIIDSHLNGLSGYKEACNTNIVKQENVLVLWVAILTKGQWEILSLVYKEMTVHNNGHSPLISAEMAQLYVPRTTDAHTKQSCLDIESQTKCSYECYI